jgi:hypothetical protein
MKEELLTLVKSSLLIPASEHYADTELKTLIDSCLFLISSTGVNTSATTLISPISGLVNIYVKTFFGFNHEGSVKELPNSFYFLLKQLSLSKGN